KYSKYINKYIFISILKISFLLFRISLSLFLSLYLYYPFHCSNLERETNSRWATLTLAVSSSTRVLQPYLSHRLSILVQKDMALEITQFLLAAQSADAKVRTEAEANLRQFQEQNLPAFLLSLSFELANNDKPTESRRLAGIVLKNSLDAKDAATKDRLVQQWMQIDVSIKTQIKDFLLSTLGSPVPEARHTSAQVVAKIAAIEIPQKQWPALIGTLLANMTQRESHAGLKQATLETFGYVCEEISHRDLEQAEVNNVLTAVVQGMNFADNTVEVRLAATKALYNALDFAETNFQNEMERNFIMKVSGAPHSRFIEKALASLVPMLLETLLKQEEDQDQDDSIWNVSMAGGTCLGLVARTVGDSILPLVMPFVESNIMKPDWRCREAATYAFGSILEGPSLEKLSQLVQSGLDFLLKAMKDENNHVKDTTAWTLSRIFELLHNPAGGFSVVSAENLERVVQILLEGIQDAPNVAEKVCGAIYYLAQGYEDAGPASSVLTRYIPSIIDCLLKTANRADGGDLKLRSSAYETLNEVVRCSNIVETSSIIAQLLPAIMEKLSSTVELQIASLEDREKQGDLQASLCGVLQVIIQKLSSVDETKTVVLQTADQIMVLFLKVFACRSSTVHEEAMLAIGALAYATGTEFERYMQEFYRYLETGLQNFEEYQVCAITVGVVGDICRALDGKVLPYCDRIMDLLIKDLSSEELHRSVKPPIFSCFGDIALAIEEHFEKYVPYALQMMQGAAELCARMDTSDDELIDYANQLKRNALGPNTKLLFREKSFYVEFLGECLESDDEQLKETATWTKGMINRIMVS
ncbi:hypothetical protein F8388_022139, partial [Cannabis sativa]